MSDAGSSPGAAPARALLDGTDRAFRAGLVVLRSPPTRFYVNLTEACNLRCTHCITSAPERTERGIARTLGRDVLDALTPHLGAALYLGLSHAGEPTTAPMLEPLLESLRAARAGQPYTVHLLTNGHSVGERRFVELTELGVSSWSFSVDGMHARTHDSLRVGSRSAVLLERIRSFAAIRRDRWPGVRIGVAWTLTRANLPEVPELIDFAASAGLDWVKLEEVAPVNAVARALMVPAEELAGPRAEAHLRALARGVALHDHLEDVTVWKCGLDRDPRMERFSRLDDLSNRMEINSCRFPYEVVCVEPNGDVKPIAFNRAVAGNLLSEGLPALWNGPHFILERSRAMLGRPCGRGPLTCPTDQGPDAW